MIKNILVTVSGLLAGILTFLLVLKDIVPSFIAPLALALYVLYIVNMYRK
ncbi:MAG: hypothetical protein NC223_11575 [Butyrivibrio sp.]|nr:hypothetical protein [Butyrivibrio sp.]